MTNSVLFLCVSTAAGSAMHGRSRPLFGGQYPTTSALFKGSPGLFSFGPPPAADKPLLLTDESAHERFTVHHDDAAAEEGIRQESPEVGDFSSGLTPRSRRGLPRPGNFNFGGYMTLQVGGEQYVTRYSDFVDLRDRLIKTNGDVAPFNQNFPPATARTPWSSKLLAERQANLAAWLNHIYAAETEDVDQVHGLIAKWLKALQAKYPM